MKKLMIGLTAALLVLTVCTAAAAEVDAADLYGKTVDLLFHTENVTVQGTAEFFLNGQWFKTAEVTLRQDGNRAFRQLLLSSPRKNGTELHNGYTIVMEGGQLYVMEVYHAGTYTTGTTGPRNTILRSSVETEQLIALGAAAAPQAELLLGPGALKETPEGDIRLTLGEDAPAAVNVVLNQLARFAAKRYFGMDYDRIRADSTMPMKSFVTVTEGLLYTMKNISVKEMDITFRMDENGNLSHIEGAASLYVESNAEGKMQLDISFSGDVTDYGTTEVKAFDPEDYGVTLR